MITASFRVTAKTIRTFTIRILFFPDHNPGWGKPHASPWLMSSLVLLYMANLPGTRQLSSLS